MKNVSFEYCSGCRKTTPHQRQDHAVLVCKACGMVKGVPRKGPKAKTPECIWSEQHEGDWHTACGQGAYDDPVTLKLTYCAYCGKRIAARPFKEEPKP